MKTLVIYDSVYGNTEEIAKSMGEAIGSEAKVVKAENAGPANLTSIELLIVGSPTYGGRPTPKMKEFLDNIRAVTLKDVKIAAFDTRFPATWVKIFGFAAGKIEKRLKSQGGTSVIKPEGFYVSRTKGPLVEGEYERAAKWAQDIMDRQ
ncbi:MAG TPA: flavodoxin family protein [Dehalococcoidia bacterium]|nr:flavodoxin family protein [Dehalococcoidia bacterium]